MKNLTIVGVLMLAIGFAVGWLAKPAPLVRQAAVAQDAPPSALQAPTIAGALPAGTTAPAGKRSIRETGSKKPGANDNADIEKQGQQMQAEMMRAMGDRTRSKFTLRIDQLAEKLNLTPAQKAQMTAMMEKSMAEFEKLDFTDPAASAMLATETGWMPTEKALLESLQGSLSPEQRDSLNGLLETERRNKVDTLALKNLSKLQGIVPLEEGQREEIYKILTASAETSVNAESDKPDPTAFFTDGMGLDMDPYDLGVTRLMTDITPEMAENPGDTKNILKSMKEAMDKRIEAKVDQLRPVLNDKQLEMYRNELKGKGMGIYGQAFSFGEETTEEIIIK